MFGQRLRLARKKAGLSMQRLAEQIDPPLSAQAISKYEKDQMMPSSSVLVQLGKTLGVSLDFLMAGHVKGLRGVEFRKHSATSAQDQARAEAIVIEHLEDYLAIEEILELPPQPDRFGELRNHTVQTFEEAEALAIRLRQHWNLGNDPIPSMTRLLEDKGIRVIEADLPPRFDGLACDVELMGTRGETEVVVVSSQSGIERKRFNLAHELAHRVIVAVGPGLNKEKAMHRFAGAFLVPGDHLKEEIGDSRKRITYHEIVRLKQFHGVSAAALLMRLRDVAIVSPSTVDYAFRTYARSWRKSEPEPIGLGQGVGAFESPARYKSLVWRALGDELISPVRAAQMLHKPLKNVEQQIRGPQES
ncbi:MAG: ImmA/IrrE family metallo-endopeptidase [Alphaproteobacteria bacterium]|nr:ImmA/IrrE family metallo-endopeptidase [Alphaproteobacteria bacterium]